MEYELIHPRRQGTQAIEQVLLNRGIKDIEHFLNTTDADILDPLLLDNMHEGAKLLVSHIGRGNRIHLIYDVDCDGYTSSALFINYLNCLFPSFTQNNITYNTHNGKQHGIDLSLVPEDVKLLVMIDSASSDYEQHEILKEKGIDILIIDHHLADKVSEYAIVINNQLCDYPTKSLSGVGIAYKFCSYIDTLMGTNYANNYLDLVALGGIADVMSLADVETKHLISKGLKDIRNPYFKGMTIKNAFSLGEKVTPFGVAFYIAPYVNAVTRCGTQEEKLVLFESMLEFKAYEIIPSTKRGEKGKYEARVEQACRNCTNVKNRQTKTRDASLEIIEQVIEQNNLLKNKILCVTLEGAQRTSLAGLVANQLMGALQKPVLILSKTEHTDDNGNIEYWYEGSGRAPASLKNCKDFYKSTGLVEYCSGHQGAFGLGIKANRLNEFIEYTNNALADVEFTPNYKVDFIFDAKRIKEYKYDFYNLIDYDDIWGHQVEQPLIVIEGINITKNNINLYKGSTMVITLSGDPDISLVKFKVTEEEFETLCPNTDSGCVTINVVGKCERNTLNGKPQLKITDYEIMGRAAYYF